MLKNRREAGRLLGRKLAGFATRKDVVVLGLPRGGVPVAYEVARALGAPLDVMLMRWVAVPGTPEISLGVIGTGGIRLFDPETLARHRVPPAQVQQVAAREEAELARRQRAYIQGRPPLAVQGKTVFLVDDGAATETTLLAAIRALRERRPARIVVGVPAAPTRVCERLRTSVDAVVSLMTPDPFESIRRWYEFFEPTTDGEVRELLALAWEKDPRNAPFPSAGEAFRHPWWWSLERG